MKQLFILICLFTQCLSLTKAEKHGLLIGVGEYPTESGWKNLSSENDIKHIQAALRLKGFQKKHITIILNQEATKANIIQHFKQLANRVTVGDIVFIHFSGHGQQIADQNGDEIDRLDEAIVPYDSPLHYQSGIYEGNKLIRDDELRALTQKIRTKLGAKGQLILVLDACHAGTGTRGKGTARGTDIIMAAADFKIDFAQQAAEVSMGISTSSSSNIAPMASYFGTSANEANYQSRDNNFEAIGTLSYALSGILANARDDMTFEELFERIKLRTKALVPNQNPSWEGPKNEVLFAGWAMEGQEVLYPVVEGREGATHLKIGVGTLLGLFKGSQLDVYSVDKRRVINTGHISQTSLTESILALEQPLQKSYDELLKVSIRAKTQRLLKSYIQFDLPANSQWANMAQDIKRNHFIETVNGQADLYFQATDNDRSVQLATPDGTILLEQSHQLANGLSYKFLQAIKAYAQGKFLRAYNNANSKYQFSIQILLNDTDQPATAVSQLKPLRGKSLKVGSNIQIAITNKGKEAAYFSLIDIQPDNQLNLVIPPPGTEYTAEDFYLKPGATYLTQYVIGIGEPLGEETLKLICTDQALDLSNIIQHQGTSIRGNERRHAFEQILAISYQNDNRSVQRMTQVGIDEIGTATLFFRIEE
jgi:hypothetical protein